MFTKKTHPSPSLRLSLMHSGLLSPLCCRGFPAGTAPDAGSTGESSPGPHQHFCLCCAPATGAMSITSAAWSTWHPPSNTSSQPSAGVPVLVPGSFRSPSFCCSPWMGQGAWNTSRPRICISTSIYQVFPQGALFFKALSYQALTMQPIFQISSEILTWNL